MKSEKALDSLSYAVSTERKPGSPSLLKILLFAAKLLIAAVIIIWLMRKDYSPFLTIVKSVDPFWIGIAAFAYCSQLSASAWRWQMLLRVQQIELGYWEIFSLMMQGNFFSLVIPGGPSGGDLVKAGMISARLPGSHRLEGVFSIVMDRLTGLLGLFLLAFIATIVNLTAIMKIEGGIQIALSAAAAVGAAGAAGVILAFAPKFVERIHSLRSFKERVDSFSGGAATRFFNAVGSYRGNIRVIICCILLSTFAIHGGLFLTMHFVAFGLGEKTLPPSWTLLAFSYGNMATMLPITPSGIGTRDAVAKSILGLRGLRAGADLAIPLVYTAIVITFALCGGIFFLVTSHTRDKSENTQSYEKPRP